MATDVLPLGFSFQFNDGTDDNHLWFIATKTSEPEVVILNFTTCRKFSDRSCIITQGQHPFVMHDTCVEYARARITTMKSIQERLHRGDLRPREQLSKELMMRVWDGASVTKNLPLKCRQMMIDQNILAR